MKDGKTVINNNINGIGFFGLMGVAFIVLKLTNVIDWSWWLILAPLYFPLIITILFFIVFFVLMAIGNNRRKY